MTKSQHKRTAVASMFQNGISRNTKCAVKDSFRRDSHICGIILSNRTYRSLAIYTVASQFTSYIKHIVSCIRAEYRKMIFVVQVAM